VTRPDTNPTAAELRRAFQRSGLWRRGWNYQRAITTPLILKTLEAQARAARLIAERQQPPPPDQLGLI